MTLHSDTPSAQVQQTAQYDPNNEVTHLTALGPSGVANRLNSAYDYAYNGAGWTTALTWTVNTTGTDMVTATQLAHDSLGRLTSWTGQPHGPESWAFDGHGNIIANSEFISDAIRTTAFTYDLTLPNQLDQQHTAGLGVEYFGYGRSADTTSITIGGAARSRITTRDLLPSRHRRC